MIVSTHVAFVRTLEGTVLFHEGDTVPDGVATGELERLVAAGVISEAPAAKEDPEPSSGRGRKAAKDD